MSAVDCRDGAAFSALVDHWFDEQEEPGLEEHLLACNRGSEMLGWIAWADDLVPGIVRRGETAMVLSGPLLQRLRDQGVHIREYRLAPGGSVKCTIAPTDDLVVVAHLDAPLAAVTRLDLVASSGSNAWRVHDIPFDARSSEVVLAPRTRHLRSLWTRHGSRATRCRR